MTLLEATVYPLNPGNPRVRGIGFGGPGPNSTYQSSSAPPSGASGGVGAAKPLLLNRGCRASMLGAMRSSRQLRSEPGRDK